MPWSDATFHFTPSCSLTCLNGSREVDNMRNPSTQSQLIFFYRSRLDCLLLLYTLNPLAMSCKIISISTWDFHFLHYIEQWASNEDIWLRKIMTHILKLLYFLLISYKTRERGNSFRAGRDKIHLFECRKLSTFVRSVGHYKCEWKWKLCNNKTITN